ncbi:aminoglycoside phosphotransferase family protein [Longispora urticae]
MTSLRLHDDEFVTDAATVRALLAGQFPRWAELPLVRIGLAGTMNQLYRLGEDLLVRLPRRADAVEQLYFERDQLPRLAPHLPVRVPEQLALGASDDGYPYPWAVYRYVDGDHPGVDDPDGDALAEDLAEFLLATRALDPTGARAGYRTGPLGDRDDYVREWAVKADGIVDAAAVLRLWDEALAAPAWTGGPVWAHSDLMPGNLLVREGRLSAVLDFGAAGVGDPACDLTVAWNSLPARSRRRFRAAAGLDEAAWARARGWAMTWVGGIAYYRGTNPALSARGERALKEILAEA